MNPQMLQKLSLNKSKFTNPSRTETGPQPEGGIFSSLHLGQNSTVDESQLKEDLETSMEIRRVTKELEDYVKNRRIAFEEKMFERFYLMRIEQSRKFIDLIRKINKSWDDFVDYLKSIGAQGVAGDGDCTVYSITNSNSLTALSQASDDDDSK